MPEPLTADRLAEIGEPASQVQMIRLAWWNETQDAWIVTEYGNAAENYNEAEAFARVSNGILILDTYNVQAVQVVADYRRD